MAANAKDIMTGSVAGLAGVMALVGVAQFMWDWAKRTRPEDIKREEEIEPKDPFPMLAQKAGVLIGVTPTEKQETQFAQYVTVGLGVTMGALYAVTARRWPLGWLAGGIVFGTLFWAIEDETMGPVLGLAGDNAQYPAEAHVRGWAAHVAFGVVTAAIVKSLGVRPESGSRSVGRNGARSRKAPTREEIPTTV
ncbi:MAG: hypothetical protein H0W13_08100 [Nitrospirales bacterium]|nr:hypothetical protein [Nitrospirales bacterium]